jgi:probable F420-dependent oxidoreductase
VDIGVMLPQIGYAAGHDEMVDVAQAAETLGFSSLWVGDHIAFPVDFGDSRYPFSDSGLFPTPTDLPFLEPFISLGFVAAATTSLRLGLSACVLPHRSALHIAKSVATLDYLSGGRVDFGAAVGWLRGEIEALGGPFDNRGPWCDEVVDFLRAAWTSDGAVSYDGKYLNVNEFNVRPLPPQGADLPVYFAGVSQVAKRRAARCGGWLPGLYQAPPEWVREAVSDIRGWRGPDEAPLRVTLWAPVMLADADPDPADEAAQPWRTCMISGTPEYIANLLNTYQDAGVDRFALWMPGPDMTGSMQRFVDQVRPLLR